jgi:hypothetical protein
MISSFIVGSVFKIIGGHAMLGAAAGAATGAVIGLQPFGAEVASLIAEAFCATVIRRSVSLRLRAARRHA